MFLSKYNYTKLEKILQPTKLTLKQHLLPANMSLQRLYAIDALKFELDREQERNAKLTKLLDDSQEKYKNLSSRLLLAENRQKKKRFSMDAYNK